MYKDSGDWHIIVGTGKSLAAFQKKEYVYPVLDSGKYIQSRTLGWFQQFSFLIIVLCINDLYRLSGSSDHKGIQQHLVDSGNDVVISHSSLTDVTFCRVDVPFFSDPLHITLPTDPRYIDKTR